MTHSDPLQIYRLQLLGIDLYQQKRSVASCDKQLAELPASWRQYVKDLALLFALEFEQVKYYQQHNGGSQLSFGRFEWCMQPEQQQFELVGDTLYTAPLSQLCSTGQKRLLWQQLTQYLNL